MKDNTQIIKLSRSRIIHDTRPLAELALRDQIFHVGEVKLASYRKDPDVFDTTGVGVLVAVGLEDGCYETLGHAPYRVLSVGGTVPVRRVGVLPDVSEVINQIGNEVDNQIWVFQNEADGFWYYASIHPSGERIFTKITDGPFIFIDLETGYRWFYRDQECKREDDYFTTSKIDEITKAILNADLILITRADSYLFDATLGNQEIALEISAKHEDGRSRTTECRYYINGEEIILREDDGRYFYDFTLTSDTDYLKILVEARYYLTSEVYTHVISEPNVFRMGYMFYYGIVGRDWLPTSTEEIVSRLSKLYYRHEFRWDDIDLNLENSESGKIYIAYPKKYGALLHIFDDNGLDYIDDYSATILSEITIRGVQYYVYVKRTPVTINGLLQKFTFEESEVESEIEKSQYVDLLDAWNRKNTANGLTVLDDNGKIPVALISGLDSKDVAKYLKGIVNTESEIPEDYEIGDLWYASTERYIYRADTSGYIKENPDPNSIYVYDGKFYTGNFSIGLSPLSNIHSTTINNIKELWQI